MRTIKRKSHAPDKTATRMPQASKPVVDVQRRKVLRTHYAARYRVR
jgi:hypothetical protein